MSDLNTGLHYPLMLGDLPSNWRVGYIGDFANEIQPGFASGKHNKDGEGIPHIRPFNIDRQGKVDLSQIKSVAADSDRKRLHSGDVLFNNTNSPELIGKTAVVSAAGDWGFSNHMTRIHFRDDIVPKFAAYQLHFLWVTGYYLHNCVKHVNQASISSKSLANAVPFVAPPFDQQVRIVAEFEKQFSRLDEAVANLKRVKANLKRYKAAVLKAAVEGRLVETEAELARREGRNYETGAQLLQRILETRRSQWKGKGKYKEPAAPDATDLPDLPEVWVWSTVDQLLMSLRNGLSRKPEDSEPGIPILRISAVRPLKLDAKDTRFHRPQANERPDDYKLEVGDVLFVRYNGNKEFVGACALVNAASGMLLYPDKLIRGRVVSSEQVVPAYLAIAANVGRSRQHIDELIKTTAGQQGIAGGEIKQMPLPLPPYAEQRRIVAEVDRRLSLILGAAAQVEANLKRAERLRQSVLNDAFNGKLLQHEEPLGAAV